MARPAQVACMGRTETCRAWFDQRRVLGVGAIAAQLPLWDWFSVLLHRGPFASRATNPNASAVTARLIISLCNDDLRDARGDRV